MLEKHPGLSHLSVVNDAETRKCISLMWGLSEGTKSASARLTVRDRGCVHNLV